MGWIISAALMDLFESSRSSPGREVGFWEVTSSAGAPSAPSSGSPTPPAYSSSARMTESSPRFPSGTTFAPLTEDRGAALLTWFLEGFLARTYPQQAREQASPALVRDYGVRWRGLFMKFNPDTFWWRTPPSLWDEDSLSSSPTLPRWGSMQGGELWERVTLVRRINETASGFLPTPVKYDSHGTWESNNYHGLGWSAKHAPESLDAKGKPRMWPTPVKNEDRAAAYTMETSYRHFAEGSHQVHLAQAVRDARMWPTPTHADGEGPRGKLSLNPNVINKTAAGDAQDMLSRRVRLQDMTEANDARLTKRPPGPRGTWPTPTCTQPKMPTDTLRARMQDGKHDGNTSVPLIEVLQRQALQEWDAQQRPRNRLPTPTHANGLRNGKEPGSSGGEHHPMKWQHPGHPEYGELNPEWVEWIMGWCIGWTSLEPMDPAAFHTWWMLMQPNPATGYPFWWDHDPSDIEGPERIPKTVKPVDKDDDNRRMARIAALGNGQVSAVVCGTTVLLARTEQPEGD